MRVTLLVFLSLDICQALVKLLDLLRLILPETCDLGG